VPQAGSSKLSQRVIGIACAAVVAAPALADAYIGPGAGFAVLGSFAVLLVTMVLAGVSLLLWPFRTLWRILRRRTRSKPLIKRLIFLGFDGQDAQITERMMAEGKLPKLSKLADQGCYHRLRTTYPSITPVAWSTFSTGTNPGRHNIFDFLDRDPRTYLPRLSSTHIGSVDRFLKLGTYRIPLKKPDIRLLRKSKPWWTILGEHNVWSTVIRVPITFPPDTFYGAQLGAMCIPDLLGTQGTFLLFTTRQSDEQFKEGGLRCELNRKGDSGRYEGTVEGPENSFRDDGRPMTLPITVDVDRGDDRARVSIDGTVTELSPGELSDWVKLQFPAIAGMKVNGICRMMVIEMDEHVSLYVSPINIEPAKPAMPIAHPSYYSTYLEKKVGPYATLGLAEDTWALNEGVTDDRTFWTQTLDIDREREQMLHLALDRLRKGALVTVFDAADRANHMFWRYIEDGHPAARGIDSPEYQDAIENLYRRNDEIVGRVMDRLHDDDVLVVLSDHGCTSFRRGINLNAWLREQGYLYVDDAHDGEDEWLQRVDWSKTRAYAVGLVGIFLNLRGLEAQGLGESGDEYEELKQELAQKLGGLVDAETGDVAINEAFDTDRMYRGPYKGNAPDLLIGYNHGYRISWEGASGVVGTPVFEDNEKPWSGDHIVDPRIVPGIVLSNHAFDSDDPHIADLAPTALTLFGIKPPSHMDGTSLIDSRQFEGAAQE
jgi:predicted AlkP superfamily phosphohydrolase/phosphomutase